MTLVNQETYDHIRSGGAAYHEQKRGLIAVWGQEAVQFLDGLISNDMKTLGEGDQMLAAFPNAQGRLLAVVRVLHQGGRFLFDTEDATREKVFQNLFRFTFAGDFFVEDLSDKYRYFELFGAVPENSETSDSIVGDDLLVFSSPGFGGYYVDQHRAEQFRADLIDTGKVEIWDEVREILRIENGEPLYGVDMDDTTIVPELGLDGLISYNKGCYIGQEIIARIHFRGHVAKRLTGIVIDQGATGDGEDHPELIGAELRSPDGKNAGRITSQGISPKLGKTVAMAYVRYDYLAEGTQLLAGDMPVTVAGLPFVSQLAAEVTHA